MLVRGGQIAGGLAAAGALAGPARAVRLRRAASIPTGGKVTWAVNQDPTALAPFGVLLEVVALGQRVHVRLAPRVGPDTVNIRPALAESYVVKDLRTIDSTLRKGVKFHNGNELTAADARLLDRSSR